ncbi:MAG: FAD:protein FMN transferase [Bacteroidales bacterium]|nr:FAD:protein FMN transferase [Bacteroidales bacterium]
MKRFLYLSLTLGLFCVTSCNPADKLERFNLAGEAQGTYFAITYYDAAKRDFRLQVDSILKAVDESVSLWVEKSLISRINNGDSGVIVDRIFRDNFNKSLQVSLLTDGYFDFTIGPLAQAWGFHRKNKLELNDRQIDSLRNLVDFRKVHLRGDTVSMDMPNMRFDFNAIAQGYTTDLIAAFFDRQGIKSYLIDVGGEIFARNTKPKGERWRVGIEKPSENADDKRVIQEIIELENKALATSGSYRKYFEMNGKRYSHAINPKTGRPVDHNLLSVTVMADDAMTADAFATAFLVMGLEKAENVIKTVPGLEAYFIYWTPDHRYGTFATEGLKKCIAAESL